MSHAGVCAVVVTFHPEDSIQPSLAEVRAQADALVVVDNGSGFAALAWLRPAAHKLDFTLIEAGENLGIAAAQNLGIAWAQEHGFESVLFLDQDSVIPPEFAATLRRFFEAQPGRDGIATVVPLYRDRRLGTLLPLPHTADGSLELAMSSGSLIPIPVLQRLGRFEEGLFIDYVDYEFCLRARAAGYRLVECPNAVLLHAPADLQVRRLMGLFPVTTSNYSPMRRYYLARNLVWMVVRYGRRFPRICLRFIFYFVKEGVKIIVAEQDAWAKSRASLRGLADGLRGRMGRTFAA